MALFIALTNPSFGEGIEFFQGTFEEAKALANEEGKIIFVDAYTSWCGPCKRMSKMIFPKAAVGEFYNEHFVNVKLDMEKGEGRNFQKQYRVTSFPTFLFLDPSGKVVHKVIGGMDEGRFVRLGQTAAKKGDVTTSLDKEYNEGNRDPAFVAEYLKGRAKANKPVIKIANEYLQTKPDLSTETSQDILFYGAGEADSRVFRLMVSEQESMVARHGKEAYDERIEKACNATAKKGVEFKNLDLVEEAIDKYKKYRIEKNANFPYEARLRYFGAMDDAKNYLKTAKGYARLGNAQRESLCKTIIKYMRHHPSLVKAGDDWSSALSKDDPTLQSLYLAAQFQLLNGRYEVAKTSANKAYKIADESGSSEIRNIKSLIRAIDNSAKEPSSTN